MKVDICTFVVENTYFFECYSVQIEAVVQKQLTRLSNVF